MSKKEVELCDCGIEFAQSEEIKELWEGLSQSTNEVEEDFHYVDLA